MLFEILFKIASALCDPLLFHVALYCCIVLYDSMNPLRRRRLWRFYQPPTGAALGFKIDGAHNLLHNLIKPCHFFK